MQGAAHALLLAPGVLGGVHVVLASAGAPSRFGAALAARCEALGAQVELRELDPLGDEPEPFEGPAGVLVWDGAGAFGARDAVDAVRAALDGAWLAIRPVARPAMIDSGTGGKLLLLAPPPGGAHAAAARAGLENLARTLSVEWARFGVRLVALHPGSATRPGELAELAAFLASRAGDYYSGCRFSLGEADAKGH